MALDLVRWADVVIESFSPRAMKGWRLDYGHLREVNPDVIMLSTCLNGQDGPLASFAGYGNLGAALAGFYGLAGWPDRAPAGPFGAYTDYTSTHLLLATLLAALDHRRRTGEGQYLDVAQAEAAIHYLSPAILDWTVNGRVEERQGNEDPSLAPHGVYPAAGPRPLGGRRLPGRRRPGRCWPTSWAGPTWPPTRRWPRPPGVGPAGPSSTRRCRRGPRCGRPRRPRTAWSARGVAAHAVNDSAACLADPQLQSPFPARRAPRAGLPGRGRPASA